MTDARFAGHGFVYCDEQTSPDGSLHVLNGYSGGENGPTFIEPRVVSAATGKIIFDLWHSYQNYNFVFGNDGRAILKVDNHHSGRSRVIDINFIDFKFAFRDAPDIVRPLSHLEQHISLFDFK